MLMASVIWLVGEVLKTGVVEGMLALFLFPLFSIYWTFWVDYGRCHVPFFIGMAGSVAAIVGYGIGIA